MEPKDYQIKCLEQIKTYLGHLFDLKQINDKNVARDGEDAGIDFPSKAWGKLDHMYHGYTSRRDGMERPLPCFCVKVPTGGGKTFLAVKAIDLINTTYLKKQTGLVLWVVPTTQIYRQTLKSLRDREHPYRQHLDIASGGQTVILEKTANFTPAEVSENLVVLLLQLASASRKNKDVLRMFRDSGNFMEFFPSEDRVQEHVDLRKRIPNLDTFEKESAFWGKQIKTSLGNTLRRLNPILIMDEGHKAYSKTAQETLQGFNPSVIVELSATPPTESNVLVDITGVELDREEMIKFDLHIINKASPDWKDTMLESHNKLKLLDEKAKEFHANQGKYIRPICLIQVERTGKDQRGSKYIHAEDVREYLQEVVGIDPEEVAIKTSEKDELKEVDNVGGLMSPNCKIRYIITKQALQEGWDCAFAYVLCVLTNPGSKTAMTQLVGRILRQPYAKKTQIPELDESYVFCFQQKGATLLEDIRKGFKGEGLGDLAGRVGLDDDGSGGGRYEHESRICEKFKESAEHVILPVFAIKEGKEWRPVNHSMDIVSRIGWDQVNLKPTYSTTLSALEQKDTEQVASISDNVEKVIEQKDVYDLKKGSIRIDSVFMARHLMDIVPNPWVAHEIGDKVLKKFIRKYGRDLVTHNFVFIIEELRKNLLAERDRLSKEIFHDLVCQSKMRFLVIMNEIGFHIREKRTVKTSRRLTKKDGQQLERSLFDIVPEDSFNNLEKEVAWYLEEQNKLLWWFRNESKKDYWIQGWKKNKIYADFIFTDTDDEPEQFNRVYVVETKGMHLMNPDTDYKKSVFQLCNKMAKKTTRSKLGLELDIPNIAFHVIHGDEWERKLNELFNSTEKTAG